MSSSDEESVAWLRAEIGSDLGRWRATAKGLELDLPLEAVPYLEARDHAARCEAALAMLDAHPPVQEMGPLGEIITRCACQRWPESFPCCTVRLLGSGYKYRTGFPEAFANTTGSTS